MKLTKDELKEKVFEIKTAVNYCSMGQVVDASRSTYLYDVEEAGIKSWGYTNNIWGQQNHPWETLSDTAWEAIERFVELRYPKTFEVTRETYLIDFKNVDTGEVMTVNLKEKKFTKTNAKGQKRDVKYPHTFFRGMDGRLVSKKIPADDSFRKLVDVIIKKEHKCSNMGTFLVRLFDNIHLETYISAGVKFQSSIKVGYDFFDKDIRNILNKHNFTYEPRVEQFFANNPDLGKSMLYFIKDEKNFADVFYAIANNMRDITNLVDNYKYDVKRLFEYCSEREWKTNRYTYGGRDLVSFINDYARMAELVFPNGFDKYPKDIIDHHDGVSKLYAKEKIKFDDEKYKKLIDTKLEWENKDYCMIFPKSTGDIQSEGRLLGHCVGSYVNCIIQGTTTILFLRKKKEKGTPLVTVEVKNKRISQASGKFNRALEYDEKVFLQEYAEKKKLEYTARGY